MVVEEDALHGEDGGHEEGAVHVMGVYPGVLKVKLQLRLDLQSRSKHLHLPFESSSLSHPGPTGHCSSLESDPGLCCGLCWCFPWSHLLFCRWGWAATKTTRRLIANTEIPTDAFIVKLFAVYWLNLAASIGFYNANAHRVNSPCGLHSSEHKRGC